MARFSLRGELTDARQSFAGATRAASAMRKICRLYANLMPMGKSMGTPEQIEAIETLSPSGPIDSARPNEVIGEQNDGVVQHISRALSPDGEVAFEQSRTDQSTRSGPASEVALT